MKPISRLLPLALAVGLATVIGCASPPPPGRVYVVDRPPPVRAEIIPVRPGRAYVWIPGYWGRGRRGYEWVSGRYVVPPGHRRGWVPGRWYHGRGGWYFIEGHWR